MSGQAVGEDGGGRKREPEKNQGDNYLSVVVKQEESWETLESETTVCSKGQLALVNVLIASVGVLSIGPLHWPSRRGLKRRPSPVPVVLTCRREKKTQKRQKKTHHICPPS